MFVSVHSEIERNSEAGEVKERVGDRPDKQRGMVV